MQDILRKNQYVKPYTLTFICFMAATTATAQTQDLTLVSTRPRTDEEKPATPRYYQTVIVRGDSSWAGIPSDCNQSVIRKFAVQQDQATFEKYLAGQISPALFKAVVKERRIDTTQLSRTPVPSNYYYVFLGLNPKGEKIVIVDADQDRDFGDDTVYRFDTAFFKKPSGQLPPLPELTLATRKGPLKIKLDPYEAYFHESDDIYQSRLEYILELAIVNDRNWVAEFVVGGQAHQVKIWGFGANLQDDPASPNLMLKFASDSLHRYEYDTREAIRAGNALYSWENVNDGSQPSPVIALRKIKDVPVFDARPGDVLPPLSTREFVTGQPLDFSSFKGKYVLLDFWGTWCVPCMELLPKIREHHARFRNQPVTMVSVAFDFAKDEAKLRETIQRENMHWQHIWQDRAAMSEVGSFTKLFKVQAYPTFILISPQGEILYRGTAAEGLQKAVDLLNARLAS